MKGRLFRRVYTDVLEYEDEKGQLVRKFNFIEPVFKIGDYTDFLEDMYIDMGYLLEEQRKKDYAASQAKSN